MDTVDDVAKKVCELKGSLLAVECMLQAMALTLPESHRATVRQQLQCETEACRVALLGALISEHTLAQFELDAQRLTTSLGS